MDFSLGLTDSLGTIIAFALTLFVFSYIFGDNVLFRLTIHVFVGVAAGYALAIAFLNVIWPQLVIPLLFGSFQERLIMLVPVSFSLLLLAKISPRFSGLGTPVMAFLVGVGAAAAIGGAVFGTLVPQSFATMNIFEMDSSLDENLIDRLSGLGNATIILLGTLSTFAYFHFGVRPNKAAKSVKPIWLRVISWVGQAFIAVTFAALFAGVYTAALISLIDRWEFVLQFIRSLFPV